MMGKLTVANNSPDGTDAADTVNNTTLKSEGMYYLAGDDDTTSLAATEELQRTPRLWRCTPLRIWGLTEHLAVTMTPRSTW